MKNQIMEFPMIKLFINIEDKKLESLIKVFIEDFYNIIPSDIKSLSIEDSSSILIADKEMSFSGYLIGLLPLSLDQCRDKNNGRCFYLPKLEMKMYMFLTALDDTFNVIKTNLGMITDDTFLMIPAKYSNLLTHLDTQIYQKVGSIRFNKVDDLKNSKSETFYIERKNTQGFLEHLKEFLIKSIENKELEDEDRIYSAHDLARIIGIDKTTMSSVDKLTSDLTKSLIKISDLKSYIDTTLFKKNDYINLLKLTMYCSVELCRSESSLSEEKTHKKLVTATLLMDLFLPSDEEKLVINIDDSLKNLSKDQKNMIMSHTLKATDKLSRYVDFGQDELRLIERHHERPDGHGFPRGLGQSSMTMLQNLFITSYRFSHYVIVETKKKGLSSSEVIKRVNDKMNSEGFSEGQCSKFFSLLLKKSNDAE